MFTSNGPISFTGTPALSRIEALGSGGRGATGGTGIGGTASLVAAARFVTAPPVSADDLRTLIGGALSDFG